MTHTFEIVTLPGDGIGVDVTREAVNVLRAVEATTSGVAFRIAEHPGGAQCYLDRGADMPAETWTACRQADAIYLGAMGLPHVRRDDGTEIAPQLDLRFELDLYAGIRPVVLFHEAHCPLKGYAAGDIDFVLVRESTEGLFVSRDHGLAVGNDTTIDHLVITRAATQRVVKFASELAAGSERKGQIVCVDKANVFQTYAFFRQIFNEVVDEYPQLERSHTYIDAMALYLVQQPRTYDVIVTENMFGDILSDLSAALVGGMGMAPSADIGENHAVFQPAHGTAPDLVGKDAANPIAAILSVAMMLDHLATRRKAPVLVSAAALIRRVVTELFAETPCTTPDLGGTMTCTQVGAAVCDRITRPG